jgi:hypothetical protein
MWNLFNHKRTPFCLVKNLQGPSCWLYEVSQTIPCSIGDDHNISQWESGGMSKNPPSQPVWGIRMSVSHYMGKSIQRILNDIGFYIEVGLQFGYNMIYI